MPPGLALGLGRESYGVVGVDQLLGALQLEQCNMQQGADTCSASGPGRPVSLSPA